MKNEEYTNKITLIKEVLGAEEINEPDTPSPPSPFTEQPNKYFDDKDLQVFLDEREAFRNKIHQELSMESYLKHYDELCRFGLDEYFMECLHWHICLQIDECDFSFFKSEFYRKFKNYKTVRDIVDDYDPDKFNC